MPFAIVSSRDLGGADNPTGRMDVPYLMLVQALRSDAVIDDAVLARAKAVAGSRWKSLVLPTLRCPDGVATTADALRRALGLSAPTEALSAGIARLARAVLEQELLAAETEALRASDAAARLRDVLQQ